LQQEKNSRPGGGNRRNDDQQYNNNPNFSEINTRPYGQQQEQQQTTAQPPAAGAQADPYAAYGGYENYVALWYSSLQQNPHQAQGPPGS